MSLRKITDTDLQGKGVVGMEDTPNLSAREMQEKVEEIVRTVIIPIFNENVDNTVSDEKLADVIFESGSGDMASVKYDKNQDGVVDRADNGFFTYTHKKSGNVHYLTGSGDNIKFVSTADYEEGDVFMIDGNYYPAFFTNGEQLPDGFFKTDFMVSCFKHGNCLNFRSGGAGGELNLNIVGGTTQPASPKENTIWVNTDLDITGWAFDSVSPNYLSTGGVWIKTVDEGDVSLNVLKKNAVKIILSDVYQWNGTEFVTKTAYIYSSGVWTEIKNFAWVVTSYDGHDELTGGWTLTNNTNATARIGENGIELVSDGNSYEKLVKFATKNSIDFTDYSYMEFDYYGATPSGDGYVTIRTVSDPDSGTAIANSGRLTADDTVQKIRISLASVTGAYYITGYLNTGANNCVAAYINNIKLVR